MVLSSIRVYFFDKFMIYVKERGVEEIPIFLFLLLSIGYSLLSNLRLRLLQFLEYQVTDLCKQPLEPLLLPRALHRSHLPSDSINLSDGLL
jgi:hypothetical protein